MLSFVLLMNGNYDVFIGVTMGHEARLSFLCYNYYIQIRYPLGTVAVSSLEGSSLFLFFLL
jgi:hypothetical protein